MTTKEQRAKFEAATHGIFGWTNFTVREGVTYNNAVIYLLEEVQLAWMLWHAAIASQKGQDAKDAARYRAEIAARLDKKVV